jgi:lipopolysaccharide assembly protein A
LGIKPKAKHSQQIDAMAFTDVTGMEVEMTAGRIRLVAAVGLVVLAIIWILQNGGSVQTKFLFVTVTMPQPALLAITLLVGVAAGILLALNQTGKWNKKDK